MATETNVPQPEESLGEINKYDFQTKTDAVFKAEKGLNADIVNQISSMKEEPQWMRDFRLVALHGGTRLGLVRFELQ